MYVQQIKSKNDWQIPLFFSFVFQKNRKSLQRFLAFFFIAEKKRNKIRTIFFLSALSLRAGIVTFLVLVHLQVEGRSTEGGFYFGAKGQWRPSLGRWKRRQGTWVRGTRKGARVPESV
ncbi:hypothetical protein J1N35_034034 [Gossypium stocksii]|uniref:Uncharacterized protein n=1 Tax=Gossypium stocksii TaxID=47602 RepID=A0A9D3UT66_9ROSI|nr:hypothetical protein J1N35_034034 [Gossypium stocksii]